ncbi:MAG TPA: ribosome biogenesis factor YjgA [Methylophilaceae bacterium]|nr:ribosome biogenesis factor YjgA [Methylophilaceae bacterium]
MKSSKTDDNSMADDAELQPVSKTKRKAAMDALQDIGVALVALPKEKLAKLDLPETLADAIKEAKRITANGATRRQMQYIGRLMREIDTEPIVDQLQRWEGKHTAENAHFHQLERWRTRLLEDEGVLAEFMQKYPGVDSQQMRTLIRNAKREHLTNKPPKSSRELFKLLREIIEEHKPDSNPADEPSDI